MRLARALGLFVCVLAFAVWFAGRVSKMPITALFEFDSGSGAISSPYTESLGTLSKSPAYSAPDPVKVNGRLRAGGQGSVAGDIELWVSDAPAGDRPVSLTAKRFSGTGVADVATRHNATTHTGYFARQIGSSIVLLRYNNGTSTQLGSGVSQAWTAGDTNTLTVAASGSGAQVDVSVYWNGVLKFTESDTSSDRITADGVGAFQLFETASPSSSTGTHVDSFQVGTNDVLTAGAVTFTSRDTTTRLVSEAATGGSAPYAYQWHRSTSSGFTPGVGTTIAGATNLTLNDSGLTPNTVYYYVLRVTDDDSAVVDSEEVAVTTYPTLTDVFDANVYWSPGNWYSDGAGAFQTSNNMRAGSTFAESNNPGAYLKLGFNGTTFKMPVLTDHLVGDESTWPTITYLLDADPDEEDPDTGAWVDVQLGSETDTPISLTGLSNSNHTIYIAFRRTTVTNDRWDGPGNSVKVIGFITGSTVAPTGDIAIKTRSSMCLTDSIGEAYNVEGSTQDSLKSWVRYICKSDKLNCEYGLVGFSTQGYTQAGSGNVPAAIPLTGDAAIDFYSDGRSRLRAGMFWPRFHNVFDVYGANSSGQTTEEQAAIVKHAMEKLRLQSPDARLFKVVPFGGFTRAGIEAGFEDYQDESGDAYSYKIDLGPEFEVGLDLSGPSSKSDDGIHPNTETHIDISDLIYEQTQGKSYPPRGAGLFTGVI